MKILITGATSGIGYLSALTLAEYGNFVYLTCHTIEEAKYVKRKLKDNKNIEVLKLDITDSSDVNKILKLDIDCLISNAAISYGGSLIEFDINNMRKNFEVNVFSNFDLIKKFITKMIDNKKCGRVIIISSIAGVIPIPFASIYSATKASISTITASLQKELKLINSKVKVVLVEPGLYHTGFNNLFLDNKYDDGKYFSSIKNKLYDFEHLFLRVFEKKDLDSIVIKIVRAVLDKNPKCVYRAPISQVVISRIYRIFRK